MTRREAARPIFQITAGIVVACLVLAACPPALAQGRVLVTPTFLTRAFADDNRRMRTDPGPTVLATTIEAGLASVLQEETYSASFHPRVRVNRYTKEPSLESEDYFIALGGSKMFERNTLNLGFNFQREGTATTELTDSGLFDTNAMRTTLAANLSFDRELSNRLTAGFFGGYTDVAFEQIGGLQFNDYTQGQAGVNGRYRASDQTTLTAQANVSRFATPNVGGETVSYAFNLGFEHELDETLNVAMSVGHNISRISSESAAPVVISLFPLIFASSAERASGQLLNVNVEKTFSKASLEVEWARLFSPSSQGGRQKRQEVNGRGRYDFTDKWTGSFDVNYREQRQEGTLLGAIRALDVLTAGVRATYHLTQTIDLDCGYRFRRQTDLSRVVSSRSHEVLLEFRYRGLPRLFGL